MAWEPLTREAADNAPLSRFHSGRANIGSDPQHLFSYQPAASLDNRARATNRLCSRAFERRYLGIYLPACACFGMLAIFRRRYETNIMKGFRLLKSVSILGKGISPSFMNNDTPEIRQPQCLDRPRYCSITYLQITEFIDKFFFYLIAFVNYVKALA